MWFAMTLLAYAFIVVLVGGAVRAVGQGHGYEVDVR